MNVSRVTSPLGDVSFIFSRALFHPSSINNVDNTNTTKLVVLFENTAPQLRQVFSSLLCTCRVFTEQWHPRGLIAKMMHRQSLPDSSSDQVPVYLQPLYSSPVLTLPTRSSVHLGVIVFLPFGDELLPRQNEANGRNTLLGRK